MNQDIKDLMRKKRIYNYEVAAELHISEITLCRWLKKELPEEKKDRILQVINNFKY